MNAYCERDDSRGAGPGGQPEAVLPAAGPRQWLYGDASEVTPCCGDIGELRGWLNALATCQGEGAAYIMFSPVLTAYESAARDHETLTDRKAFPLLHRVLDGIRAQQASDPLVSGRQP